MLHVKQQHAGGVGVIAGVDARELVGQVVLREHDLCDSFEVFRLVFAHPEKLRRGEARERNVGRQRGELVLADDIVEGNHDTAEASGLPEYVVVRSAPLGRKNVLQCCKAVLDYRNYVEITPQFIQEKIVEDKKYFESSIKEYEKNIEKFEKLINVDTGDWSEEDKRTIAGWTWKRLSGSELKIKLHEYLERAKERIQENKDSISEADSLDPEKMVKLFEKMIPDLERLKEEYQKDDDGYILSADDYGCSEEEFNWAIEFLNDKDNIDTYGSGYDESRYDSRAIDGVMVHVLSYSGYGC